MKTSGIMYTSVGFFTVPLSGGGVDHTAGLDVVAKRFRVYSLYCGHSNTAGHLSNSNIMMMTETMMIIIIIIIIIQL
jgi:hypothetical protein